MKININSNHIRIYRLLDFIPNKNIDFICQFLRMNKQNVILYIKQIYSFIENKKENILLNDMIDEINNNKSLFKILKQYQTFTKEDRRFYIILILLKNHSLNHHLNLNTRSSILDVSRRTLSDDITSLKQALNFYNLEICSIPSKGISILGDLPNIKSCFLSYLFKLFVEFEDLPTLISEDCFNFFQQKISEKTIQEIDYFLYIFKLDMFANNKKLLTCVYLVNLDDNCLENISTLSLEEFKKYFFDIFSFIYIEKAYNFFKTSTLGKYPLKNINILILSLKFCIGILKETDASLDKEYHKFLKIFSSFTFINCYPKSYFERFVNRINVASKESSFLSMYDLCFTNWNLDNKIKNDCYKLFIELRKDYFNIQFSNIIFLYLCNLNNSNLSEVTNTIVIFRDLPKFLHSTIKDLFLLKENIRISRFIKYYELDTYLLHEDVSLIITFENLDLKSNNNFIKYYPLPM